MLVSRIDNKPNEKNERMKYEAGNGMAHGRTHRILAWSLLRLSRCPLCKMTTIGWFIMWLVSLGRDGKYVWILRHVQEWNLQRPSLVPNVCECVWERDSGCWRGVCLSLGLSTATTLLHMTLNNKQIQLKTCSENSWRPAAVSIYATTRTKHVLRIHICAMRLGAGACDTPYSMYIHSFIERFFPADFCVGRFVSTNRPNSMWSKWSSSKRATCECLIVYDTKMEQE